MGSKWKFCRFSRPGSSRFVAARNFGCYALPFPADPKVYGYCGGNVRETRCICRHTFQIFGAYETRRFSANDFSCVTDDFQGNMSCLPLRSRVRDSSVGFAPV